MTQFVFNNGVRKLEAPTETIRALPIESNGFPQYQPDTSRWLLELGKKHELTIQTITLTLWQKHRLIENGLDQPFIMPKYVFLPVSTNPSSFTYSYNLSKPKTIEFIGFEHHEENKNLLRDAIVYHMEPWTLRKTIDQRIKSGVWAIFYTSLAMSGSYFPTIGTLSGFAQTLLLMFAMYHFYRVLIPNFQVTVELNITDTFKINEGWRKIIKEAMASSYIENVFLLASPNGEIKVGKSTQNLFMKSKNSSVFVAVLTKDKRTFIIGELD
jgi:hypothetical protein